MTIIPKSKIDLTGQTFGRLTVDRMLYNYDADGTIKKATYCDCSCSCGGHKLIVPYSILAGRTKSCGCLERESRYNRTHSKLHTGDRFGRLTLIKDSGERMPNHTIIWECECDCGNTIYVSSSYLIKGWWTSCGCSDNVTRHHRWNLEGQQFGYLTVIHKDEEMMEKKKRTYWLCKCDCGNTCSVPQSNLLNGWSKSCGCQRSAGAVAKSIADRLRQRNIKFEKEYRFDGCKDRQQLPFDYYLPDLNIAIEYDGIQHFKPVDLFGGEQAFLILQEHDRIKNEFCEKNNIRLIRIPYTMSDEEINNLLDKL